MSLITKPNKEAYRIDTSKKLELAKKELPSNQLRWNTGVVKSGMRMGSLAPWSATSNVDVSSIPIDDLLIATLEDNADQGRAELSDIRDRISRNNHDRDKSRELKSLLRDGVDLRAIKDFIRKNLKGIVPEPESLDGDARDNFLEKVEGIAQGLNDMNSENLFELQVIATRVNQAEQAMSKVFKKFSDTASSIINNI